MPAPAANLVEYSVSELSAALKRSIEDGFSHVRVRGEISGFKGPHSSGHAYFSLKDDKARLEAVIWRTTWQRLRFKPEEGLEVIATGKLTTFPGSSKYQIVIDTLEPAGVGALMALLEERRKTLAAEGLFDETRKKPLPYLPRVIGIVTSPTGAVIHDILHRLADRFPVEVLIWPVTVQGETSAAEVAAAIRGLNALAPDGQPRRPDLIIVARGGGSLEDLWSFNEEIVVRAAAASAIPLISAIGHETDWTLIDHAADRRAPTPTGAAEMAVPVRSELIAKLDGTVARHGRAIQRVIEAGRRELVAAARGLPGADELIAIPRRTIDELSNRLGRGLIANAKLHRVRFERTAGALSVAGLERLVERQAEKLATLAERKQRALSVHTERKRVELSLLTQRLRIEPLVTRLGDSARRLGDAHFATARNIDAILERRGASVRSLDQLLRSLSYRSVLARGFALVRSGGEPLHSAAGLAAGAALDIEFHDGHVGAVATSGGPARRATKKGEPSPGSQGRLF